MSGEGACSGGPNGTPARSFLTVPSLLHDDTAAVSPTARRNLRHRPRVQGCAALWAGWLKIYEGDLDAAHGALVLALLELEAEI